MTIYQGDRSGRATLVGRTWGTRCLEGDEKGTRGSDLQDALFLADALVLGTHIIAGRRASPATGTPHPLKLAGVSRLANAAARGYDRTPWAARRGLSCGRRLWAVARSSGAWLALPSRRSTSVRRRGAAGRNLGGTPPSAGALLEVYAQVKGSARQRRVSFCKTVGLAYVGSNPTPATTSGNSP